MANVKVVKTSTEGCCLTNMLALIECDYAACLDTVDGYLLSMPIGVGRLLKVTYCHGNSGILIINTKVKTLDERGWGLFNTDQETLSIRFDKYVKLLSVKEEIDEAMWKFEQQLGYGDTYVRDLGGDLFVRVYGAAQVEIIQYSNNAGRLDATDERITLSPEEWLYFNLVHARICAFVPQVKEMMRCIEKHTMCDGSLSCGIPD
jgi:hypothetical protein